jgi:galactose-1-phosphate uridylyltransferase
MENQKTISEWGFKTFGYPKDAIVIVKRMLKESNELEEAIKSDVTYDMIADECADIYIVMCHVFATMGFDLHACVDHKMEINRARKWKISGDGTGQHIKE